MKKLLFTAAMFALAGLPALVSAQDVKPDAAEKKKDKPEKKETQEIIIRNRNGKDINLKVEINGDQVTVNGKPLSDFNEDGVTISKRRMTARGGDRAMVYNNFGDDAMAFNMDRDFMKEWKGKEVSRPFLGVTTEKTDEGAKVTDVVKASAAEKAGLKVNDVITKIGDEKITDEESLAELVAAKKPKEAVKVTYMRNGKESSVKAVLGERKVSGPMAYSFRTPNPKMKTFTFPKGAPNLDILNGEGLNDLEHLAPGADFNFSPYGAFPRQKRLGLKIQDTDEGGNVKVIDVEEGSAAEKAGLKKDDIITEISGKKITNTDEAREQLNPEEAKSSYSVKALRNGTEMTFDVKIPKKLKTANL
jgi:serine protease Do